MNKTGKKTLLLTKKKFLRFLFIPLALLFFFFSCSQDSLFYDISHEPEPKDPLIPGSPTNITLVGNRLYVGTRMGNRIFCYSNVAGNLQWSTISLPTGSLGELASDDTYLYALIFPSGDPIRASAIRRYDVQAGSWDTNYTVSGYSIQSLYGAGGRIFAGGQYQGNRQNFVLMYLDTALNSLSVIRYGTSLLKGAAIDGRGTIYLATMGDGIFAFNENTLETSQVSGTANANMNGIINVGGSIVAVTGAGEIYTDSQGSFTNITGGANYTGALCLWLDPKNQWKPSLLLLGIRGRGSSLSHGYQEMVLSNGRPTFEIKSTGDGSPTSVKNKAKYSASIGTHPVISILQVPDSSAGGPLNYLAYSEIPGWEPPIFASTSKDGLWSYRDGEWNAEE